MANTTSRRPSTIQGWGRSSGRTWARARRSRFRRTPRVKIKAGPHTVAAAFPMKASGPVEDDVAPIEQSLVDVSNANVPGLTSLPHLHDVGINGPYNVTGVSDFASRNRIFVC